MWAFSAFRDEGLANARIVLLDFTIKSCECDLYCLNRVAYHRIFLGISKYAIQQLETVQRRKGTRENETVFFIVFFEGSPGLGKEFIDSQLIAENGILNNCRTGRYCLL